MLKYKKSKLIVLYIRKDKEQFTSNQKKFFQSSNGVFSNLSTQANSIQLSSLWIKYEDIFFSLRLFNMYYANVDRVYLYQSHLQQTYSLQIKRYFQRYYLKNMRNSPINNIRGRGDYSSSPYDSNIRNRSPPRDPSRYSPDRVQQTSQAEYWRTRAKALESQLLAINEQLLLQMRKNERIDDLQQKIELLLAQNTHFVDENENLIRLLQQKNQEIRLLKQKLDNEYVNSNMAQAQKKKVFDHLNIKDQEHQVQIQKLVREIGRLQDQVVDIENLKQIQISQLKNKYENEAMNQIQNLKRSQFGNNQLQELNIRKLKDTIEEKSFEIQNLRRQAKLQSERLNGEISFLKNQIKKLQHQKQHELNLLKTQSQNAKNNLIRAYRKNQQELKSLHETKLRRLNYELEQRRNQADELGGKLRKGGKQNQNDLNHLVGQKNKMRVELKQSDNKNRERITELTKFYESQLQQQRDNHHQSQSNLENFYKNQINSLKQVIEAKEQQIRRLLELNRLIKQNEQKRLSDIISNNNQLKKRIQELVLHYEREIQLMKIKISQLYEADIEALRSQLRNTMATHNRQTDNLRNLLKSVRQQLISQVHAKLQLRKDYENRLNEFKIKFERQHHQLQDLIVLHEKQIQNQTSKASMTQIEHTQVLQTKTYDAKKMMTEKRQLQVQIANKNKEIQELNLRIQKMTGYHKRQITKLQEELGAAKADHQQWLQRQDKQAQLWNQERAEFKEKIHQLNLSLQDAKTKNKSLEQDYIRKLEQKNLKIASLQGQIQQLKSKAGQLHSKAQVQVENIEKTYLDTQALMNVEKQKFSDTSVKQKSLLETQFNKQKGGLQAQVDDLKRENELLKDNYQKSKIREEELKSQIGALLESASERSKLQDHVINIGLSNNYFKNVAQIFKKTISL